jgi:hypothetical protein
MIDDISCEVSGRAEQIAMTSPSGKSIGNPVAGGALTDVGEALAFSLEPGMADAGSRSHMWASTTGHDAMADENFNTPHPFSPRPADIAGARRSDLERFLGGSPFVVFARLALLSLLVGFFLVWLDIRPMEVLIGLRHLFERFWAAGFDAIREIGTYVAAGAAIVVPLWLILRLFSMKPRG